MATDCPLSQHHVLGLEWAKFSHVLRGSFVRHGIVTAAIFRGSFDGSHEDATDMCQEFGGSPDDVATLCRLWVFSEPTAAA